MARAYEGGRIRPWLVLGQCPGCLQLVREGHSRYKATMPGARIGVHWHLTCQLNAVRSGTYK